MASRIQALLASPPPPGPEREAWQIEGATLWDQSGKLADLRKAQTARPTQDEQLEAATKRRIVEKPEGGNVAAGSELQVVQLLDSDTPCGHAAPFAPTSLS